MYIPKPDIDFFCHSAELVVSGDTNRPISEGEGSELVVLPACPAFPVVAKRGWLDQLFPEPPKRPTFNCSPGRLKIDVHFRYVANGFLLVFPLNIETRIRNQVSIL